LFLICIHSTLNLHNYTIKHGFKKHEHFALLDSYHSLLRTTFISEIYGSIIYVLLYENQKRFPLMDVIIGYKL